MNNIREDFSCSLNDVSQEEKIYHIDQLIIDLMDYTEQTDEEKIWCDIHKEFRNLVTKYNYKLKGYNIPL